MSPDAKPRAAQAASALSVLAFAVRCACGVRLSLGAGTVTDGAAVVADGVTAVVAGADSVAATGTALWLPPSVAPIAMTATISAATAIASARGFLSFRDDRGATW